MPNVFDRLCALVPKTDLKDTDTGRLKITRAEIERLRGHYAKAGIDLAEGFASERELMLAWLSTLTDEEANHLADVFSVIGFLPANWRDGK